MYAAHLDIDRINRRSDALLADMMGGYPEPERTVDRGIDRRDRPADRPVLAHIRVESRT